MKGIFITLEGGEGSGKTTVINNIRDYFINKGRNVITTREPGGIVISEEIRNIILDVKNVSMTKETETLLYAAARMQHLAEKIIPALEKGDVVICDRYIDSSYVYQGIARGVGIKNVEMANHFALSYLPDLTIFLDVRPEIGLKRIQNRGALDRLDLEKKEFHDKVYNGYKEIANMFKDRIVTINGENSPEVVLKEINDLLDKRF
ncbi:MAG: dTMP kinase [Anaeroplasmataceae bacterium]